MTDQTSTAVALWLTRPAADPAAVEAASAVAAVAEEEAVAVTEVVAVAAEALAAVVEAVVTEEVPKPPIYQQPVSHFERSVSRSFINWTNID